MFIQDPLALFFYICFLPEIVLIFLLLVIVSTVFSKCGFCSSVLNRLLFWLILEVCVFEIIMLLYLWGGVMGSERFTFGSD